MNYDSYKLISDRHTDLVTSCCGSEKEARYIKDEEISICVTCCEPYPDMIEEYEYDEKMKEHYAEMYADEKRDLR
jgi:endonuclease IV